MMMSSNIGGTSDEYYRLLITVAQHNNTASLDDGFLHAVIYFESKTNSYTILMDYLYDGAEWVSGRRFNTCRVICVDVCMFV